MLSLGQKSNGLEINFNGYLFVRHTEEAPFLHIGKGKASYQMLEEANFIIEENLFEKFALTQYEILENTGDNIKVRFSKDNVASITVNFQKVNNRLEAFFEDYSTEFNRIWIRLKANPEEGIFGCG